MASISLAQSPASLSPPRDAPPADHADWCAAMAAYCARQARAASRRGDRVEKYLRAAILFRFARTQWRAIQRARAS
jgi:hypothetical protein